MKKAILATLMAATLFLLPGISGAQEYEPSVGQAGKDVIWVPTPDDLVNSMLDMAKVTADDFVIDLGSGDGRIVIAAAKRGARAMGVEYNPEMVELSKRNAEKAGVSEKATFLNADLFTVDLSKATVVTMYLLPSLNMKLRPIILNLKPGTRIVSHAFNMGEWQSDQSVQKEGRTAYMWYVPAKVQGKWTWPAASGDAELNLTQIFQKIEGSLKFEGKDLPIEKAKLEGNTITFVCAGKEYEGQVSGRSIEGTIKTRQKWSASEQ